MLLSNGDDSLRILVSGDPGVGKSVLLQQHSGLVDPSSWPTLAGTAGTSYVFKTLEIGGKEHKVIYGSHPQTHVHQTQVPHPYSAIVVCILCFSLVDLESYEHVRTRWFPELVENTKDREVAIFLYGTKRDLRELNLKKEGESGGKGSGDVITYEQGLAMQKEVGAVRYFECSSLKADEMFYEAAVAAVPIADRRRRKVEEEIRIQMKKSSRRSCIIA